ncbi:MAG: TIGR02587 family membrane protein [Pyrinomonadaceae bacterium]
MSIHPVSYAKLIRLPLGVLAPGKLTAHMGAQHGDAVHHCIFVNLIRAYLLVLCASDYASISPGESIASIATSAASIRRSRILLMSPRRPVRERKRTITESLQEYGRGVAGGLMFSLPLLFTMEVWWAGFIAHPYRLLIYVMATFVLLLGYNRYAGLRQDSSMIEVAIDSFEEMGIGIVLSALVLCLLGRIKYGMSGIEVAGQIVVEAMTVAIGVSIGTAQLSAGGKTDEGLAAGPNANEVHFGGQIVLGFCGAMLFAANIAPTEEVVVVAAETSWVKLLGLAIFSLLIAFLILHYSDFKGASEFVRADHPTMVLLGTLVTYAIALTSSAMILWFFGRFEGIALFTALAQTIVLGLPAVLGASAGRLLLQ